MIGPVCRAEPQRGIGVTGRRNVVQRVDRGGVSGTVASLLIVPGTSRAAVTMTSRIVPTAIEQVNIRLLRLAPEG